MLSQFAMDPTVTLGNILVLGGVGIGVIVSYSRLKQDAIAHERRITALEVQRERDTQMGHQTALLLAEISANQRMMMRACPACKFLTGRDDG